MEVYKLLKNNDYFFLRILIYEKISVVKIDIMYPNHYELFKGFNLHYCISENFASLNSLDDMIKENLSYYINEDVIENNYLSAKDYLHKKIAQKLGI